MILNKQGLDAARAAIVYQAHPETPWSDEQVSAVIIAYLAALPAPDGLVERLRGRYTPEPVPPCSVCGNPLSIQSAGGGNATVYGCENHRPFDMQHYERSRWTQFRPGDPDVLEAATVIQTLQRERDALREALRPFAERAVGYEHLPAFETDARFQHLRRARLLLKEGGE